MPVRDGFRERRSTRRPRRGAPEVVVARDAVLRRHLVPVLVAARVVGHALVVGHGPAVVAGAEAADDEGRLLLDVVVVDVHAARARRRPEVRAARIEVLRVDVRVLVAPEDGRRRVVRRRADLRAVAREAVVVEAAQALVVVAAGGDGASGRVGRRRGPPTTRACARRTRR